MADMEVSSFIKACENANNIIKKELTHSWLENILSEVLRLKRINEITVDFLIADH